MFSMAMAGSYLIALRYVELYTSGFVGDVTFSHNGPWRFVCIPKRR